VPVVDDNGVIQGVVTVDDVIDAAGRGAHRRRTALRSMEALDEPYTQIGFFSMIRKRAPWLAGALSERDADNDGDGALQDRAAQAVVSASSFRSSSLRGNSGSQATSLISRALALGEIRSARLVEVALRELAVRDSCSARFSA